MIPKCYYPNKVSSTTRRGGPIMKDLQPEHCCVVTCSQCQS